MGINEPCEVVFRGVNEFGECVGYRLVGNITGTIYKSVYADELDGVKLVNAQLVKNKRGWYIRSKYGNLLTLGEEYLKYTSDKWTIDAVRNSENISDRMCNVRYAFKHPRYSISTVGDNSIYYTKNRELAEYYNKYNLKGIEVQAIQIDKDIENKLSIMYISHENILAQIALILDEMIRKGTLAEYGLSKKRAEIKKFIKYYKIDISGYDVVVTKNYEGMDILIRAFIYNTISIEELLRINSNKYIETQICLVSNRAKMCIRYVDISDVPNIKTEQYKRLYDNIEKVKHVLEQKLNNKEMIYRWDSIYFMDLVERKYTIDKDYDECEIDSNSIGDILYSVETAKQLVRNISQVINKYCLNRHGLKILSNILRSKMFKVCKEDNKIMVRAVDMNEIIRWVECNVPEKYRVMNEIDEGSERAKHMRMLGQSLIYLNWLYKVELDKFIKENTLYDIYTWIENTDYYRDRDLDPKQIANILIRSADREKLTGMMLPDICDIFKRH